MSEPENPLDASPVESTSRTSVIHSIVSTALAQPLLVLAASAILAGVGVWSFSRLPIDAYPDLSPPLVGITTQWPGQAAEEVERLTSVPIETEMNGLPGIQVIRSISLFGLSKVDLIFKDGIDPYFAREQVFQRLSGVGLPAGVTADVEPLFSPSGLVYRYVLTSPDRSPMELKTLNDWVLSKAYKAVPGVADMSGFGGPTMQYQVLIDPTRLAGAGLAVSDVVTALGNNNGNAGGGFYSEGGQFYYVRGLGRLQTPEDIGNVVLTVRNGAPILVKDVGTVEIGYAPRLGLFGFNRNDDAVEGVILMRTGEQAQTVLKAVQAKTDELNRSLLPKDVKVLPVLRPQRSDPPDNAHGRGQPRPRHRSRCCRADLLPVRHSLRAHRRGDDPAVAAVRVHLPRRASHSGQPAVDRRHRLRHAGGRRGRDGGEHPPQPRATTWYRVLDQRGDHRRGLRGRPADRLRRRDHRRGLPAHLCAVRAVGPPVHADGRHHDLRAGRFADPGAHVAAGALCADSQARCPRTP